MMRIDDAYLEVVIYLYKNLLDAEKGEAIGASGFLVAIEFEKTKGIFHFYVVTARHVIGGMNLCPVIRINTRNMETKIISTEEADWIHHEEFDDLSICLLKEADIASQKIKGIKIKDFITEDIIRQKNIGIGDNVFMVGRFIRGMVEK